VNAAALTSEIQPLIDQLAEPVRTGLNAIIAQLTGHISEQQKHISEQQRYISDQQKRIAILEEQRRLDALARFASKADRIRDLNPNQLELLALEPGLNEAELDAALTQTPAEQQTEAPALGAQVKDKRYKRKAHPGREPWPAHLRREDILIDEPPAPLPDGTAPQELRRDITERLAVVPAEYYVERITTVSYIFPGQPDKGVHRGAGPAFLLSKSLLAPSVAIAFVIAKYADHQPVYRQVMALERDHGITLSYPTADRAVIDTAALALPLADAMLRELIADDYLQADETRIPVMDPRVKGKTATGYLWTYSHPRGQVVYRYHPGRGGKYARSDLDGFAGWLQSDGYQVYQSVAALFGDSVRHCACLSHVRRKLVEIIRANQDAAGFSTIVATAAALVARIGELYDIERALKESQADHATREEVRAARSLPLFDKLMSEMNAAALDENLLPGSALAKACGYALRLRAQLRRSLENGITEIDNNRCEQSIRPIALGRKNWLHIGAPGAAPTVAAIISVVESCKRMGINVRTYLSEVLPSLAAAHPDRVAALAATLTPAKWLAARTPTVAAAAAGNPA
jgi:transposase